MPNSSYSTNYSSSYPGTMYDDFPPGASMPGAPHPPDMGAWNQMSLPPPPGSAPVIKELSIEEQSKKDGMFKKSK